MSTERQATLFSTVSYDVVSYIPYPISADTHMNKQWHWEAWLQEA